MTVIRPSSISGITSVTSPSSSDLLSIHTNNTTEVARVTTSGINVTGIVTATSFDGPVSSATGDFSIADKIIHTGDTNTAIRFPTADTFTVETAGSERIRIGSDGKLTTNTAAAVAAEFNTSNSSAAYHDYKLGASGARIGYIGAGSQLVTSSGNTDFAIRTENNFVIGTNGNNERLRIDSSGRLLVNQSSNYTVYADSKLQISATDSTASFSVSRWSNNGSSPYINLGKSRGGIGSYTVVQSGDRLGQINFIGADGTDLASHAASIAAYVDGTPGSNDMPGRLVFATASDGGAAETERMRIRSDGRVQIKSGDFEVIGAEGGNSEIRLTADEGDDGADYWRFQSAASGNNLNIATYATGSWLDHVTLHNNYILTVGNDSIASNTQPSKLRVQGSYVNAVGPFGILEFKNRDNSGNAVCSIRGVRDGISGGNYSAGLTFHTNSSDPSSASDGDHERLRITSAGNIGIGDRTSSPDEKLHVHTGSGEVTVHVEGATHANLNLRSHSGDSTIKFSDASATNVGNINYDHGTDSLAFRTNSSERVRIDSGGHLLINTNVASGYTDRMLSVYNNTACYIEVRTASNQQGGIIFSDGTAQSGVSYPGYIAYEHTGNSMFFVTNTSERLRITSGGNIGVNESTPDFSGFGSNGGGIELDDVNSGFTAVKLSHGGSDMYLAASSGGGYIATRTNSMISIETNSVERMNFSNGGNVRIRGETALTGTTGGANGLDIHTGGGTSIPIYFGSEQHSAQKSLYLNGYWMYYRGHVNEGHRLIFSQSSGNAPHGNEYVFKYNSALRPGSSNTWDGWSDQRAKQNVQTITNGIAKIKQLRPITYDWTDEYADSTGMYAMDKSDPKEYNWFAKKENGYDTDAKNGQYGFIAQEYETVLPKDVKLNKFKLGDTELTDFRTINHDSLIPTLTAALKEAIAEIETLKTKVAALESS